MISVFFKTQKIGAEKQWQNDPAESDILAVKKE
jgi:hypothetical protein